MKRFGRWAAVTVVVALACGMAWAQGLKTITVGASGADFTSIQEAVNAAPETGAVIRIRPGIYREVVHVDKPKIQFRGEGNDPAKVVLVYGNSAASTCGTSCSATLFVTGSDFFAGGMTIANDYSKTSDVPSQAVAVKVTGDRAVFRHVRLLGAQDTLYAASDKCMDGRSPCTVMRQYFADCYIEGHVDFIFGDAKAVFDRCEIHSIPHLAGGYLTAQSRSKPEQDSGYVFNRCRLTADPGVENVYLGRPWRELLDGDLYEYGDGRAYCAGRDGRSGRALRCRGCRRRPMRSSIRAGRERTLPRGNRCRSSLQRQRRRSMRRRYFWRERMGGIPRRFIRAIRKSNSL